MYITASTRWQEASRFAFSSIPAKACKYLRRRHGVERLRALRLPRHLGLAVNLSSWLEVLSALEKDGAHDDRVWAHDLLVVICVRGAVGAIVAVDGFAAVAFVCVGLETALGDLEGGLGDDLVQGIGAAAEVFAGVAVAGSVLVEWKRGEALGSPEDVALLVTL